MTQEARLTRSQFAEGFLYLDGQPFSLEDYKFLRVVYDSLAQSKVLMFSRQTGKSVTLARLMLSNAAMIPNFNSLYIAPTVDQTKVFSHDKLAPAVEGSPFIQEHYLNSSMTQNVFMKQLLNQSKMFLRYALRDADRIRGYCISLNNQYLTDIGWVNVEDLTEENLVLTKNEFTGEFEYQKPTEIIVDEYEGDMHHFETRGFKLEVTPNHRLHYDLLKQTHTSNSWENNWQTGIQAKDAENFNFRMGIGDVKYKGIEAPEYFYLPELKTNYKADGTPYKDKKIRTFKEIKLPMKSFMVFIGWWLSKGWVTPDQCFIGIEHNPVYWTEIKSIFDKLFPGEYSLSKDKISFSLSSEWRTLYEYLKPLGKSGDKRIPRELLEYTEYLPLLLESLYKGDGDNVSMQKPNQKKYLRLNTKSIELTNTVQEAWLRLGKLASIRKRIRKTRVIYTVEVKSKTYFNFQLRRYKNSSRKIKNGNAYIEHYKGKIYCVVVPNGNFVTRHKEEKMPVITGNSADMNLFDETQDLNEAILPVVDETMTHSSYKWKLFAGTPKRSKGTLADVWRRSSMNEYIYKCKHCSKWNILGEDNISVEGLVCSFCGKSIDPREGGQWVSTYSQTQVPEMEGYRICALHFANAKWVNWKNDIIVKQRTRSKSVFYNETLALEFNSGVSPVSEVEVAACCDSKYPLKSEPNDLDKSYPSVLGVDYGPVNSENSFTTVSVVQLRGGKYKVVYIKRYIGKEADYSFIHQDIPKIYKKWGCSQVGADYGLGEAPNSEIRSRIGYQNLVAFQHLYNQKENARWNPKMQAFTLNRSAAMLSLFNIIKHRDIEFPKWEYFSEYAEDILNIESEYDEELNRHRYIKVGPDDFFHATLYAAIPLDMMFGDQSFFSRYLIK